MTENENHVNENYPLEVNVSDQIQIVSDVTVAPSDITVTFRGADGDEQRFIFEDGCPSDVIAKSVCEAIKIPAEGPYQGWIQERVEE